MELILERRDLNPEHDNINCSQTRFHHFKPEVQHAIAAVGRALFRDDKNHNAIYPTDESGKPVGCASLRSSHHSLTIFKQAEARFGVIPDLPYPLFEDLIKVAAAAVIAPDQYLSELAEEIGTVIEAVNKRDGCKKQIDKARSGDYRNTEVCSVPLVSPSVDGVWVSAWVFVPNEDDK